MKFPKKIYQDLFKDKSLGSVLRNTGYMVTSNAGSTVLTFIQGMLAAIILGPVAYGLLGMVVSVASNVNRLLSFRMGELVVKFGGEYLEKGQRIKAGKLIKLAGFTEILTAIIAYLILVAIAPWAARVVLKEPDLTRWIIFYGIALLANFMTETSTAVLQIGNKFKNLAFLNFSQSLLTAVWILVLFFTKGGLVEVLMAYLAGKLLYGSGIFILALRTLKELIGAGWWKSKMFDLEDKTGLIKFAISSNISSTLNLVIRDSEVLIIGFLLNSAYAGYYKFSAAVINAITLPVSQFITVTYPEINTKVVSKKWKELKRLLKNTSLIAFGWIMACFLGLIVAGKWILSFIKDGAYIPALPFIYILLIGYGFASVFYWNRNLLLSFNLPNLPLIIMAVVGSIKTVMMFLLIPRFGYLMQPSLLSAYFVVSIGIMVYLGWKIINKEEKVSVIDEDRYNHHQPDTIHNRQ